MKVSKAFDFIDHKLLLSNLFWYRISPSSINSIFYLSNGTQSVKIKAFRVFKVISNTLDPILGLLLFNINLIDLSFECDDSAVAGYSDDTTPYSCAYDIPSVITQLQATNRKSIFFKFFLVYQ